MCPEKHGERTRAFYQAQVCVCSVRPKPDRRRAVLAWPRLLRRLRRQASQGAPMVSTGTQHIRFEGRAQRRRHPHLQPPQDGQRHGPARCRETLDALRQCAKRSVIGAVVLTGAGEHAFSAGFNLPRRSPFADWKPDEIRSTSRRWRCGGTRYCTRSSHLPRPVLAAVNGVAAGVGLGMTLAADVAVAVDGAATCAPGTPSAWPTTPRPATRS